MTKASDAKLQGLKQANLLSPAELLGVTHAIKEASKDGSTKLQEWIEVQLVLLALLSESKGADNLLVSQH